jgi:hypothetical protein
MFDFIEMEKKLCPKKGGKIGPKSGKCSPHFLAITIVQFMFLNRSFYIILYWKKHHFLINESSGKIGFFLPILYFWFNYFGIKNAPKKGYYAMGWNLINYAWKIAKIFAINDGILVKQSKFHSIFRKPECFASPNWPICPPGCSAFPPLVLFSPTNPPSYNRFVPSLIATMLASNLECSVLAHKKVAQNVHWILRWMDWHGSWVKPQLCVKPTWRHLK